GISLRHGVEVEPVRIGGLGTSAGQQNRFDGLRNGILAENTPLAVHNSAFADIETADAEPYPFTGFGIRHTGGAAHPLLQRGRGASRADGPSFRNCAHAIWAEGTAADIANNYMTACGYGVQVQLAQNRKVFVNNNLMEVSRTGIDLLSNAPLPILEVAGNDITTTSRGINVEETGIAFTDAAIRSNTVTLAGKGFGLRLRGVNGLEASSNDIYMEQAVQTAAGIRVNGAVDCMIRENYVAGPGPDNLFFVGLDVLDGSSSVFDCNTFTELGTGAEFEGSCMGSTVSTNTFLPGELGMGWGLAYRSSLNIGVQSHTGNLWEVNSGLPNDGYGVAAAVSYGSIFSELADNGYFINDDTPPIYPASFDFPNFPPAAQQAAEEAWFNLDDGEVADTCLQNGGMEPIEVKDIHLKTARSEQLDEDYPGAMLWAAQLQLYRELDVEEWPADEVLDSFYLANDTTLLSAFYKLEKGRDSLYRLLPTETAQIQQWGQELDGLIGFVLEKDSLIAAGATGLENARDSLLNEAAGLCVAMDSLEQIVLQARVNFTETLLAENSALGDTAVYQTNEKLVSKIFLNTLAQRSSAFDAQQTENLLAIAGQCPLSGGRAVHYARSLYQLVADSTFADICEAGSERFASGQVTVFEEENSGVRIFPNPTSGELVVEGYCGRINIVNQLGQPVWSRDLPEGEFLHLFNLQNLPSGIYFLRAWLKNEPIYQARLIISK
ncbi:MAG: T9SS type A sorting domain-containing protein, partial [Phaeodactylibacter sp.]|nr:T9SS type A sorting domain-containing protein [Phaeodactylibacter sp.]